MKTQRTDSHTLRYHVVIRPGRRARSRRERRRSGHRWPGSTPCPWTSDAAAAVAAGIMGPPRRGSAAREDKDGRRILVCPSPSEPAEAPRAGESQEEPAVPYLPLFALPHRGGAGITAGAAGMRRLQQGDDAPSCQQSAPRMRAARAATTSARRSSSGTAAPRTSTSRPAASTTRRMRATVPW